MTDSKLFFLKNFVTASYPKKYEHPLTSLFLNNDSQYPESSSTGSDQRISQKMPDLGGSFIQLIEFKSSKVFRSGEIPPWRARNLLFTRHPIGSESNESINRLYVSSSYLLRTSALKLKNEVIYQHS
jgi:hypothetical protein